MKKSFKYLIVLIIAFCFLALNVYANETITGVRYMPSEVPNASYVIGRHIFTRNKNSNYDGQLTTQLIMLATRTIDSYELDDMIIYYKNPRGNWINGITGEAITPPTDFGIVFVDTLLIYNPVLSTPVVEIRGDLTDYSSEYTDLYGTIINYTENIDGVEISYKTSENGDYTTVLLNNVGGYYDQISGEWYYDFSLTVPIGCTYYYKIRTYINVYGNEAYSDYSNELFLDHSLSRPVIEELSLNCTNSNDCLEGDAYFNYYEQFDGIEVYVKDINNSDTFTFSRDIPVAELSVVSDNSDFGYNYGFDSGVSDLAGYQYQIRVYKMLNGQKVYSDFSNALGLYSIRIAKVDDYSPDRVLTVYENNTVITVKTISYTDGTFLCNGSNPTVNVNDIIGETGFLVELMNGKQIVVRVYEEV